MSPSDLRRAIGPWAWFTVTAGGLGHMWPASGTWGSLPPVLLLAAMGWLRAPVWSHVLVQALLAAAASRGCIRHGDAVERATGRKDPGVVVIDEVAGMALTLVLALTLVCAVDEVARARDGSNSFARALAPSFALAVGAVAFLWFRVMDVIKPPPARKLQSIPGGLGVLIDDLAVAPYAALATVLTLLGVVWWLTPAS